MGSDIVNSTAITHDENGTINTQRYTPFGEQRNAGNLETDHLYTGQILDETSGLAFYNARYYDPATGRFITPDSIVPNPLDGQDYNRYTYVRNNPIKYSDPSGHDACLGGGGGCGGVRAGDTNGDGFVADPDNIYCQYCTEDVFLTPEVRRGELELQLRAAVDAMGPPAVFNTGFGGCPLVIVVCGELSIGTDGAVVFDISGGIQIGAPGFFVGMEDEARAESVDRYITNYFEVGAGPVEGNVSSTGEMHEELFGPLDLSVVVVKELSSPELAFGFLVPGQRNVIALGGDSARISDPRHVDIGTSLVELTSIR